MNIPTSEEKNISEDITKWDACVSSPERDCFHCSRETSTATLKDNQKLRIRSKWNVKGARVVHMFSVLLFLEAMGSLPNVGIDCNKKREKMLESTTEGVVVPLNALQNAILGRCYRLYKHSTSTTILCTYVSRTAGCQFSY